MRLRDAIAIIQRPWAAWTRPDPTGSRWVTAARITLGACVGAVFWLCQVHPFYLLPLLLSGLIVFYCADYPDRRPATAARRMLLLGLFTGTGMFVSAALSAFPGILTAAFFFGTLILAPYIRSDRRMLMVPLMYSAASLNATSTWYDGTRYFFAVLTATAIAMTFYFAFPSTWRFCSRKGAISYLRATRSLIALRLGFSRQGPERFLKDPDARHYMIQCAMELRKILYDTLFPPTANYDAVTRWRPIFIATKRFARAVYFLRDFQAKSGDALTRSPEAAARLSALDGYLTDAIAYFEGRRDLPEIPDALKGQGPEAETLDAALDAATPEQEDTGSRFFLREVANDVAEFQEAMETFAANARPKTTPNLPNPFPTPCGLGLLGEATLGHREWAEAIRIATAMAVAIALYRYTQLPQGRWVGLFTGLAYIGVGQGVTMTRANQGLLGTFLGATLGFFFAATFLSVCWAWAYLLPPIFFLMTYCLLTRPRPFLFPLLFSFTVVVGMDITAPENQEFELAQTTFERIFAMGLGAVIVTLAELTIFPGVSKERPELNAVAKQIFRFLAGGVAGTTWDFVRAAGPRNQRHWDHVTWIIGREDKVRDLFAAIEMEVGYRSDKNRAYEAFLDHLHDLCYETRAMAYIAEKAAAPDDPAMIDAVRQAAKRLAAALARLELFGETPPGDIPDDIPIPFPEIHAKTLPEQLFAERLNRATNAFNAMRREALTLARDLP